MINVSKECRQQIDVWHTYTVKADITLMDGTVLKLDESKIMIDSGFKFDHGTSSGGKFEIGTAIIGKFTLIIRNNTEEYSLYDFGGAMVLPYVGVRLPDHTEWIPKGVYTVDEPKYNGFSIRLECLDNIAELERPYTLSQLSYPATLRQIWQDACSVCKIRTTTMSFVNDTYMVQERPEVSNFREIAAYVSQLACSFVKADQRGNVDLCWYDVDYLREQDLDGGDFLNYGTGDNADGGNFSDYSSGNDYDGGTAVDSTKEGRFFISRTNSVSFGTDDIKITGVQIKLNEKGHDTEGNETTVAATYLYGTGDYVLSIENNPLYQNHRDDVLQKIGEKVVGLIMRPMEVSCLGDPTIEAGDVGIVLDYRGNSYRTVATNISFSAGGFSRISADAETPKENRATRQDATTKLMQIFDKQIYDKLSGYDISVRNLNQLMSNALGFYSSKVVQADGSIIEYIHDKTTLEESMTVWKMTAEGFAVSKDGGDTWHAGMMSDGGIVATVLDAIGIRAEWINAQELDISDNISLFDPNTGVVTGISGQLSASIEGLNATFVQRLEGVDGNISDLLSKITQNAEQISLTVKQDDLISTINQSAQKIAMDALEIDLSNDLRILTFDTGEKVLIVGDNVNIMGSSGGYLNRIIYRGVNAEGKDIYKRMPIIGYPNDQTINIGYGALTNNSYITNYMTRRMNICADTLLIGGANTARSSEVYIGEVTSDKKVATIGDIATHVNNALNGNGAVSARTLSVPSYGLIGFYGKTPTSRYASTTNTLSGTATLPSVITSLNVIINALKSYGLLS